MRRCLIPLLFAVLVVMLAIEQSTASTDGDSESIFVGARVNASVTVSLPVHLHTRTIHSVTVPLHPHTATPALSSTPAINDVTPTLPYHTSTKSLIPHTKTPGLPTITRSLTISVQTSSVSVYFEVTNNSVTPEDLIIFIRLVVWNGTDEVDMVPLPYTAPWMQIAFTSALHAAEAFRAANMGLIPGVASAVYEAPSVIPGGGGGKSEGPIIAIIVVIVVVLVLIVVGVGVYCLFFRKKGAWNQWRYDEDYSMNCQAQPVNLNEMLLVNFNDDSANVADETSNLVKYGTKPQL